MRHILALHEKFIWRLSKKNKKKNKKGAVFVSFTIHVTSQKSTQIQTLAWWSFAKTVYKVLSAHTSWSTTDSKHQHTNRQPPFMDSTYLLCSLASVSFIKIVNNQERKRRPKTPQSLLNTTRTWLLNILISPFPFLFFNKPHPKKLFDIPPPSPLSLLNTYHYQPTSTNPL